MLKPRSHGPRVEARRAGFWTLFAVLDVIAVVGLVLFRSRLRQDSQQNAVAGPPR